MVDINKTFLQQLQVFKSLESIYNDLITLEINGINDTSDDIDYIKIIRDIISKKFSQIEINDEDFLKISTSLKKHLDINNDDGIEDIYLNSNSLYKRRLLNQVYYHYKKCKTILNIAFNEVDNKTINSTIYDLTIRDNVSNLFDLLLVHTLMDNLSDLIKSSRFKTIKNELVKMKYQLIFIYPELEEYYISGKENFTVTESIKHYLKYNLIDMLDDSFEEIFINNLIDRIDEQLEYIASLDDENYSIDNKASIYFKAIYAKSMLDVIASLDNDLNIIKNDYSNSNISKNSAVLIQKIMNLSNF